MVIAATTASAAKNRRAIPSNSSAVKFRYWREAVKRSTADFDALRGQCCTTGRIGYAILQSAGTAE